MNKEEDGVPRKKKRSIESLVEETYRILSTEEGEHFQSALWKHLDISSREGSRIVKELEKRGLVSRERVLHDERWTYKLQVITKPLKIGFVKDIYCFRCEYNHHCTAASPNYLEVCRYIERWTLKQYTEYLKEKREDVSEEELDEREEERSVSSISGESRI